MNEALEALKRIKMRCVPYIKIRHEKVVFVVRDADFDIVENSILGYEKSIKHLIKINNKLLRRKSK